MPIFNKESELIILAYERCIRHIEEFVKYRQSYVAFLSQEKNHTKLKISSCYKYALIQNVCLIGDTLTWFRPGKFGVDFDKMPKEVGLLTKSLNSEIIKRVVELRNLYAHRFLYEDQIKQIDQFKKLLTQDLLTDLNSIKNTMQDQLNSFTAQQQTLLLVGQIQGMSANQDPLECSKLMLEEFKLLKGILNDDKGDDRIVKAIDCHIKNICQLYKDYMQSLEKQSEDFKMEEAESNATIISDPNMAEAFTILQRSKLLRNWLAHPNMKTISQEAVTLRTEFKQRFNYLLEFCKKKFDVIYKLTTKDNLISTPSEILMNKKDNKFHSDVPKLGDFGLTDKSTSTKSGLDEKPATSLSSSTTHEDVEGRVGKKRQRMDPG